MDPIEESPGRGRRADDASRRAVSARLRSARSASRTRTQDTVAELQALRSRLFRSSGTLKGQRRNMLREVRSA